MTNEKLDPNIEELELQKTTKSQKQQKEQKDKAKDSEREIALLQKQLEEIKLQEEKLKEELSSKDDKYLRLAAEYDNFRKRAQKEKESLYNLAVCDTIENILPVVDNLERAVACKTENDEADNAFIQGVEKILEQFIEILKKMGVEEIAAKDLPFNPNLHNAVMHEQDEEKGENIVSEVFVKGYSLGDQVIRHSVVKVVN